MAGCNTRIDVPRAESHIWTGGVGATTSLIDATTNECARGIIVGVNGTLDLVDQNNNARQYIAAEIAAANFFIRGNFRSAVNTSTAHTLTILW